VCVTRHGKQSQSTQCWVNSHSQHNILGAQVTIHRRHRPLLAPLWKLGVFESWGDLIHDVCTYGLATVSRIDKIIGLFCKTKCVSFDVQHLVCVTECASLNVLHWMCIIWCASFDVHHLMCHTWCAWLDVHHWMCITQCATLGVHHSMCNIWCASLDKHPITQIHLPILLGQVFDERHCVTQTHLPILLGHTQCRSSFREIMYKQIVFVRRMIYCNLST